MRAMEDTAVRASAGMSVGCVVGSGSRGWSVGGAEQRALALGDGFGCGGCGSGLWLSLASE
jgi:hypothetical protein